MKTKARQKLPSGKTGYFMRCSFCLRLLMICRPCFRGHTFCTTRCRVAARRSLLRRAAWRYQQTARGAETNRQRQQRFRDRKRGVGERIEACVTHQSSIDATIDTQAIHGIVPSINHKERASAKRGIRTMLGPTPFFRSSPRHPGARRTSCRHCFLCNSEIILILPTL